MLIAIRRAREDERVQRTMVTANSEPVIEEAPDDEKAAEVQGVRLPRPYRRLRPEYPETPRVLRLKVLSTCSSTLAPMVKSVRFRLLVGPDSVSTKQRSLPFVRCISSRL